MVTGLRLIAKRGLFQDRVADVPRYPTWWYVTPAGEPQGGGSSLANPRSFVTAFEGDVFELLRWSEGPDRYTLVLWRSHGNGIGTEPLFKLANELIEQSVVCGTEMGQRVRVLLTRLPEVLVATAL